jgi:ribonuclease BN (tRNA processing enzyme)
MSSLTFTILGSSQGMPSPSRANSGYLLDCEGSLYLFDCGSGVCSSFRRCGYDPRYVRAVFASHMHPDHVSDLPLLIQMLYLAGRDKPLPIFLPEEAVTPFREYLKTVYIIEERLPFRLDFKPIDDSFTYADPTLAVAAIRNSHLEKYKKFIDTYRLQNKAQCFSFRVTAGTKRILYTADLGSEMDIARHLHNIDLLVIESTHIDLDNLYRLLIEHDVRQTILTHVSEDFDSATALASAAKAGIENIRIAEDGIQIDLKS